MLDTASDHRRAVAIGTFDGVHLGHRRVIARLAETGLIPTALTFHPHPRAVLGVEQVRLLCTLERRLELLRDAGAQDVIVAEFSPKLARLSPADWIETTLVPLHASAVAVGANFRFGAGRAGDVSTFADHGLDVLETPMLGTISSSSIRRSVEAGQLEDAARLLGRPLDLPVSVEDVVFADTGGASARLGAPPADLLLPPPGPYWARLDRQAGMLRIASSGDLQFVTPAGTSAWRRGTIGHLEIHRAYRGVG